MKIQPISEPFATVVPALFGLAIALLVPSQAGILAVVLAWILIAGFIRWSLLRSELKVLQENIYRFSNELPLPDVPKSLPELAPIHAGFQKLYDTTAARKRKHEAYLENSADVICSLRTDLVIAYMTDLCLLLWGYESFFMTGRAATEFIDEQDQSLFKLIFQGVQDSGEPVTVELRMIPRHHQGAVWTSWSITWSEKDEMFFCTVRDITAQKQTQQLKRDFINMINHDLRTPLTSISAFARLVEEGTYGQLDDIGIDCARKIQVSTKQLVGLVTDLLDVEKMEEGKLELEKGLIHISEAVNAAVGSVEHYAIHRGIGLKVDCSQDAIVDCDATRIVQVVQNLLSNAIKFSPAKSEVAIRTLIKGGSAEIQITDQGPGIPEDRLEYIFDRFRQLPGSQGSGLGLAICRAIMQLHDGAIGVYNESDRGATFWCKLKIADLNNTAEFAHGKDSCS